jgi:hypothetical protein
VWSSFSSRLDGGFQQQGSQTEMPSGEGGSSMFVSDGIARTSGKVWVEASTEAGEWRKKVRVG